RCKPVARNSGRGIGWRPFGKERRFRPPPANAREPMDLAVTRAQYDAVRAAKHLPDVLKQVLAKAAANGDGYTLHLTYEEATALNELCSWNVHTDAQGDVTPDGRWVAYAVATPSLADNRNVSRIWLAEVATGANHQLTQGPGSDRSPRWSPDGKTLAFLSTRQNGPQVWVLDLTGGEARRVSN